jgi:hypothetical protein
MSFVTSCCALVSHRSSFSRCTTSGASGNVRIIHDSADVITDEYIPFFTSVA